MTERHEPRDSESFYSLAEDLLFAIFDACGGGTVEDAVADALIERIRRDWPRRSGPQEQASMAAIATVLLPRESARRWLKDAAESEADAVLARFLRECAATDRNDPVV